MENSIRIHTNIINDSVLDVNMRQDFDFLEVLSLKLRQADAYKLHSSNYGVIMGRVLANDAFGIPNAKVSIFVAKEDGEPSDIEKLYPYATVRSKDSDGRRYNLLPDYSDDDCYRVVGTFPNKRLVLDNDTVLEVFDKYWKYSTVTNNSGDYMIFGIPSGNQEIKVDLDLSDIGILSQKPTDFTYKGYNLTMFDSPTQFKESTNLEGLPQLFSQNKSVFVYPFWGDAENGIAAITRSDVQIQYKFEPTCVFMGSIISDNDSNAINHKCAPDINNGMNDQLITGEGNIEMIRKTPDGLVEEFQVQTGEALIDSNGVWCYQIPMNLDYVGMDEYGNIVPTDNPQKGIPTRTQVRFRISKNETGDEGFSRHTAKYLVPMNPIFDEKELVPTINVPGKDIEKMYNFGSNTPQNCFRDLYWNNVYSVKNYIPKVQVAHRANSKNYSALKGSNLADDQNQLPFNKLRFDLPFVYMVLCLVYSIIIVIVGVINGIICVINAILTPLVKIKNLKIWKWRPFKKILGFLPDYVGCIPLSAGLSDDNTAYYPGCYCKKTGLKAAKCPDDMDGNCKKSSNGSELKDRIQQSLANEFKIVKLDLYQDWVNGVLYMPLWYWRKRKKKSFLFGLIKIKAKNQFCSCDTIYKRLKTYVTCNIEYESTGFSINNNDIPEKEKKWHKKRTGRVGFRRGLIKQVENKDGLNVYYYSAIQSSDPKNPNLPMIDRGSGFTAVRLYATDIILLGNLNENNLYGIPQLFKALPSTTANIPPIATISEPANDNEEKKLNEADNDAAYTEDSGVTLTTGMDWGYEKRAKDDSPNYSRGLFMDLACTYANTKAKSCINVERLSELGVNYDTNYDISYRSGGEVLMGPIMADGFISKYELDDLENRAMFATMNHVGFIPQPYQDEIGSYETQVREDNTGYLIPKFHYLYPVDFDGRLQKLMDRYKKGFKYPESDVSDDSYIKFRMGDITGGRIRHFYIENGGKYSMPLYNNSYYFYFGLIKGNTAIDKFNNKFFAECFQNNKDWFSMDIEKQGESYCVDAYKSQYKRCDSFDNDKAHGKINVTSDDIQIPYSYELTDSSGEVVSSATNMMSDNFLLCYLKNEEYKLKVTDGNGKSITKQIMLERQKLTVEYDTISLGTKFYDKETTKKSYICSTYNEFYGQVIFSGFTLDGYDGTISTITPPSYDGEKYIFYIKGTTDYHQSVDIKVTMKVASSLEDNTSTIDCTCKYATQEDPNCKEDYELFGNILIFYIYEPSTFLINAVQLCNGVETDNESSSIAVVDNGKNFNVYLNEMPLKFMLGTTEDNTNMDVSRTSNFYRTSVVENPTDGGLNGWFGVHDETTYRYVRFPAKEQYEKVWSDFLNYGSEFSSIDTKLDIIRLKFEEIFSVAKTTYVTESSDPNYIMKYEGGKSPILPRVAAPYYADTTKLIAGTYLYEDSDTSTVDTAFPNIVGLNYKNVVNKTVDFNPLILRNKTKLGNYFAVFTNNGGYINNKTIDPNRKVQKIPNYAAVSVITPDKEIGKDEEITDISISPVSKLYNSSEKTRPHFRAMYLDRRFDYDFVVFSPIVTKAVDIPGNKNTWAGGRISGVTFNGIEMSYDEDYNIISADTAFGNGTELSATVISVSPNNELEYSYSIPSETEDCVTKYNVSSNIKKKPYEASINGVYDVKDKFWSTFNNNFSTGWEEVPCYPAHLNEDYNGVFSITNYPTKRILDVANIPPFTRYDFDYVSCSYKGIVERTDADEIRYIIEPGDSEGFSLDFSESVEFIGANDDNKQYGNLIYTCASNSDDNNPAVFSSTTVNMRFRMKEFASEDDFDVYTSAPRILWVDSNGVNNIEAIKKLTGPASTRSGIDSRIASCSVKITHKETERPDDVELKDEVPPLSKEPRVGRNTAFPFFKVKDGDFITSDDPDYYNVVYTKKDLGIPNGTNVFCLVFKRCYINNAGENLTKYISTYEFGEMYDGRRIKIMPINGSSTEMTGSYVERTTMPVHTTGDTSIPPSGDDTQGATAQTESSGTTEMYVQVVEFEIKPDNGYCQALNDAESFGFSMDIGISPGLGIMVTIATTDDIDATVETEERTVGGIAEEVVTSIRIKARWPQEIGYLGAGRFSGGAICSLYCKSPSGFIYKLAGFKLKGTAPNVENIPDGGYGATTEMKITRINS